MERDGNCPGKLTKLQTQIFIFDIVKFAKKNASVSHVLKKPVLKTFMTSIIPKALWTDVRKERRF